jgi:hypothetical protein
MDEPQERVEEQRELALEETRELEEDDVMIAEAISDPAPTEDAAAGLKAVIEAAIYITDEPLTAQQMAAALDQPVDRIKEILGQLMAEYGAPDRGLSIRELAGGYKIDPKVCKEAASAVEAFDGGVGDTGGGGVQAADYGA